MFARQTIAAAMRAQGKTLAMAFAVTKTGTTTTV